MLQEIVIRTENADALKPLVRAAMDREAKLLEHSVERTRAALEAFEKRYDMTTEEFERKFKAREIEETVDLLDWWMEVEAMHHLENQLQSMREAQVE
ncbi:MAG: hypothetical protein IPM31_09315 [Anaerolineae bacterium]|nr:hypothetical protein [Anaerolineae bacterium]MBL8104359.1 hypothetical protein [Anaerolineales bacterium]MCC7187180.1 hypothetical protein [Anaerolineales bacterium]HQU36840.1 hypothetical protein [Anaerolineales bacterium]